MDFMIHKHSLLTQNNSVLKSFDLEVLTSHIFLGKSINFKKKEKILKKRLHKFLFFDYTVLQQVVIK
ncbi:hypothetical protein BTR25_11625 [Bacillus sp. MRMR6]|nr:hypothetical protein BTR25_11625 [Bacillus sp. MRMR6]